MQSSLLCCWKRVFTVTSGFSRQNSVQLCSASFCTPRSNLPVTPGISWLFTLHSSSLWWKGHFFMSVNSRRSCKSSHNHSTSASLALVLGHRLGLLWYSMVWLGNEQRPFYRFWDCTQGLHFGCFVDYESYFISSKKFLPTVLDVMVIWIKFSHSGPS